MKRILKFVAFLLGVVLVVIIPQVSALSRTAATPIGDLVTQVRQHMVSKGLLLSPAASPSPSLVVQAELEETDEPPKGFEQLTKGLQRLDGLFTLYRDRSNGKLYAEIKPDQLNVYHLCTVTLESGIGQSGIYSGFDLGDYLFYFRRVNNKIHFVVPNVYFRTRADDPQLRSVQRSFSNSVLQTLPIKSYNPKTKSYLVDLGKLFLTDFPGLTQMLTAFLETNYNLDPNKTYFNQVSPFPQNLELESVYGFSGGTADSPPAFLDAVPDNRSFNLRVRYSLSRLPMNTGYRPRWADDRVGYMITAYQNLSDESSKPPFVRYINRWHLEKQDPTAALSPPKQPIVFWLENTIPLEYRAAMGEGVLLWNKAFEAAGFKDAIQLKQMPANAKWDPADMRYNTIRWTSSFESGFLGIGPSHANPLTGEIYDADILIDSGVVRFLKQKYRTQVRQNQMKVMPYLTRLTGNSDLCSYGIASHYLRRSTAKSAPSPRQSLNLMGNSDLCLGLGATHQLAIGALSMSILQGIAPNSPEMKRYVNEFLRMLVAHEVGHTLGLRHNFRASAMLSPTDLNNPAITRSKGLVGSVMDYSAVNLAPPGVKQGDYYTQTIGPYDEWAIAYGYTPVPNSASLAETRFLEELAHRAPEPDLTFATDEDTDARLDPLVNRFDLSSDLLTYAPWQFENARQMWQRLEQGRPLPESSFSDVRTMFDDILDYYFQYAWFLTSYVGGQSFNRFKPGDTADRLPFEPVPSDKQRQALALLEKYIFDDSLFQFSPRFVNSLTPSRWFHWGETPEFLALNYPIYDRILYMQAVMLGELLDYDRLSRLRDADVKEQTSAEFTISELFEGLQTSIWREVVQPQSKPKISSLRRGLQRLHLDAMTRMVLRTASTPEDARSLAWYHLKRLDAALNDALRHENKLDTLTRAHLEESRDRISKILNAQLQTQ
jgi:hypothetical protein